MSKIIRLPVRNRTPVYQQGFTLLELMIAGFIFSFGVLGIAMMQSTTIKQSKGAELMSQGSMLTAAMADRLRLNPLGVNAGAYSAIDGTEADPSCSTTCSTAEQAQYDAFIWNQLIDEHLPGDATNDTKGTVTANADGTFTVSVFWREVTDSGTSLEQFTIRFDPLL